MIGEIEFDDENNDKEKEENGDDKINPENGNN